ncbi:MAG: hypothetical protein HYR76_01650 [Ignavibacteria bacterium]|nr:hypothetical protein [Ignavibacteria bacterium]
MGSGIQTILCSTRLLLSYGILSLTVAITLAHGQVDTLSGIRDTTSVLPPAALDSLSQSTSSGEVVPFHQKKSPWLAVGLSAAVPGLGQLYDENYWKPPVIWGLGGYWIYEWIHLNNNYKDFRDQYNASLAASKGGNPQYLRLRDFYRDERDKFAWFLGALYFLNLVDAYVGAHLYDFDVGPELMLNGEVVPKVKATVRLRF